MNITPARLLRSTLQWPVRSQEGARRNAMAASTALAERRREVLEVEEYLDELARVQPGPTVPEVAARLA